MSSEVVKMFQPVSVVLVNLLVLLVWPPHLLPKEAVSAFGVELLFSDGWSNGQEKRKFVHL